MLDRNFVQFKIKVKILIKWLRMSYKDITKRKEIFWNNAAKTSLQSQELVPTVNFRGIRLWKDNEEKNMWEQSA